jgi:hypothetical protein
MPPKKTSSSHLMLVFPNVEGKTSSSCLIFFSNAQKEKGKKKFLMLSKNVSVHLSHITQCSFLEKKEK